MTQVSNGALWTLGSVLIIALLAYALRRFEGAPQLDTQGLSAQVSQSAGSVNTPSDSCGCGCGGML